MKYRAPTTLSEAVTLLDANPSARVFAGATDLIPQIQFGRPEPPLLVDLKRIPETGVLQRQDGVWRVGSAVPAVRITSDNGLAAAFPGLVEATGLIGSDQIQGRATLAGNLCNASPAADSVPSLVALDAAAVIVGPDGTRSVPVRDVVVGPGATSLGEAEFIAEFRIPAPAPGASDSYERFIPRTEMDIAVVGAAARVRMGADGRCREANVVLGAVAPTVVDVGGAGGILSGREIPHDSPEHPIWTELGDAVMACCNPIDDKRGTAEFRRRVAAVLARRTVIAAARRAMEAL